MNISLTPHFEAFVTALVESGRYGNASEVIRAALRLLVEEENLVNARIQAEYKQRSAAPDAGES